MASTFATFNRLRNKGTKPGPILLAMLGVPMAINIGCRGPSDAMLAKPGSPAVAPSGLYVLQLVERPAADEQSFKVLEVGKAGAQHLVFACPDWFSIRHTTFILWDEMDRVWVYSADVGTYFWERIDDATWSRTAYVDAAIAAPPYLKRMRPKYFSK